MLAQRVDEFHNGDQSRSAIVGRVKEKKAASASKKSRRKYKKLEEEKAAAAAESEVPIEVTSDLSTEDTGNRTRPDQVQESIEPKKEETRKE